MLVSVSILGAFTLIILSGSEQMVDLLLDRSKNRAALVGLSLAYGLELILDLKELLNVRLREHAI